MALIFKAQVFHIVVVLDRWTKTDRQANRHSVDVPPSVVVPLAPMLEGGHSVVPQVPWRTVCCPQHFVFGLPFLRP